MIEFLLMECLHLVLPLEEESIKTEESGPEEMVAFLMEVFHLHNVLCTT